MTNTEGMVLFIGRVFLTLFIIITGVAVFPQILKTDNLALIILYSVSIIISSSHVIIFENK